MSDAEFPHLPPAPPVGGSTPPPPPPPGTPPTSWAPAPAGPPPGWGQQPTGPGPYGGPYQGPGPYSGPGPYPAAAQPYGQAFAQPMRRNGLAVASLVLGLVGLLSFFVAVPSLLAFILGLAAASRAKASAVSAPGVVRTGGLGQARAGWILGLVGLLAFGAFIVAAANGKLDDDDESTVGVFDLEVGRCYDVPLELAGPAKVINDVTEIDCAKPHNAEMFFEGQLNPDRSRPFPSDQDELITEAALQCLDPFEVYVGIAYDSSALIVYPLVSSEVAWNLLRGEFSCFVVHDDATPFTASVRGTRE